MSLSDDKLDIHVEDAFHFIVECLRKGNVGHYGYQLYLPTVMRNYVSDVLEVDSDADGYLTRNTTTISPPFYAAAWELCRRGIIRPGLSAFGRQATSDGGSGNGYSITITGKDWLEKAGDYDYVPIEKGRFAELLGSFEPRFGNAFRERSQEAIRCYGANAYFACCAMCGAAAESIIIAVAVAKTDDETKVLKDFRSAGGRGRVEKQILGQKSQGIQNEFRGYSSLLKYWRDIASHAKEFRIADSEAYTSLATLLRFAQFARDSWGELTGKH